MLSEIVLNVTVGDVMSRTPVVTREGASLYDALVAMRSHGVSGLPVVGADDLVVGVVSERDVARVFAGPLAERKVKGLLEVLMTGLTSLPEPALREARERLEQTLVSEAMSSPAFVVSPAAPLELAAEVMTENRIDRLPVVENRRLVGILARADLVRGILLRSKKGPSRAPPKATVERPRAQLRRKR